MTDRPPQRRARTIFIGTGPFGVPALHGLASAGPTAPFDLVGVVTTPGRPAGRRGEIHPSPIEAAARDLGVGAILALPRLRPAAAVESVLALRPELIVLADDGRIVPADLLAVPHGALNLHPSLLPRHRGATPIPATILAGDTATGVTIIRMDDGIDTGPIVAAQEVRLQGDETAPELEDRLANLAARLLLRTIGPWLRGELAAAPQPATGATLTRSLAREDGRLDPGQPIVALERRVRALAPWPGTFVETDQGRIAIHAASVAALRPGDLAGTLAAHGDTFALVAADGRLVIEVAQLPGGRRLSGSELRRGRPRLVAAVVLGAPTASPPAVEDR